MSLPDILHNWNISIVTINSVGHGLETTIRKRNIVFAIGEVTISALLGTEVIVGVVILDSVLIGVDCRNISIAGLSIGGGGGVHWGRLVHDHGFVCDRSEILLNYCQITVHDTILLVLVFYWSSSVGSNCFRCNISSSGGGWRRWRSSGGCRSRSLSGGWSGVGATIILLSIIRSSFSILLIIISSSIGVIISIKTAESLHNTSSNSILEVSSSEYGHVVGWMTELEEDWQT